MPKYAYEYGRRWDARVPRFDIHWLMGRVHVGTSDADVEADIKRRIGSDPRFTPALIRQSIKYALECHRRNRELYQHVMR